MNSYEDALFVLLVIYSFKADLADDRVGILELLELQRVPYSTPQAISIRKWSLGRWLQADYKVPPIDAPSAHEVVLMLACTSPT
ncbi:hypothetical protein NDU88_007387 [Pleurodeles waltl]|uniref:Uncharacterized protein n=1 Tax=Pleurodeles waltl TaxID=8319 RepID=A0AAV7UQB9_PLEWA|nr:hypothetical protein NDU88_007387 [Pleurodeles waltl]